MTSVIASIFIVVTSFLASVAAPSAAEPSLAEALWVPEGATIRAQVLEPMSVTNGRSVYRDGSADVPFQVTGEREQLSRHVVAHFEALGWRQRATQHMNPQMSTSFKEGWRRRCACVQQVGPDGKPIPRGEMFEWWGEWENSRGEVATYSFFAEDERVTGYGAVVPARLVRATRARRVRIFFAERPPVAP